MRFLFLHQMHGKPAEVTLQISQRHPVALIFDRLRNDMVAALFQLRHGHADLVRANGNVSVHTASAALLCPIGVAIAKQLNADPKAVIMAIAVAASCAFATPVGTPPNTLVLGPGGYKFMDYVKAGTGLVIVCFVVSLIVIPIVWPFFPGK